MMRQSGKEKLSLLAGALLIAAMLGHAVAPAGEITGLTRQFVVNPLTGVALDGFDPVSYFTETEPMPGSADLEYVWSGVPWYFASAANRDIFMRAPEIYAPQYGGYAATALSRGFLSEGNPRIYEVFSNRLYLFYSSGDRQAFDAARLPVIDRADEQWQRLAPDLAGDLDLASR